MRYHDYKIKTVGKKLVIAAYTTDKFDAALSYLKENVLSQFKGSGDNAELSVEFSEKSVSDGNYAVKSWSIAGNSLEKYRFVYENALILDSLKEMRTELAKLRIQSPKPPTVILRFFSATQTARKAAIHRSPATLNMSIRPLAISLL